MNTPDHLYRFLFEHANVRGEIVQLKDTYQNVLTRTDYPPAIRDLVGCAMAAAALLGSSIKFRGSISLQVQGQGESENGLTLLIVQATSQGGIRALARWSGEIAPQANLGELCPE